MQDNKYLFSDIVKVVMQDEEGNSKLKNISIDEIISEDVTLAENINLVTTEIDSKIISDSENELIKLELADILPKDMAELLINDDTTISSENAISFIGKEQFEGELKNFITKFVSEEVIASNVNNNKGLLLRLEDNRSAVNIEITKELNPKLSSDKIVVQALVVPEKVKIQSLTNSKQFSSFGNIKQILKSSSSENAKESIQLNTKSKLVNPNESILSNAKSELISSKEVLKLNGAEQKNNYSEGKKNSITKPMLKVFSFNLENKNDSNEIVNKQLLQNIKSGKISEVAQSIVANKEVVSSKIIKDNINSKELNIESKPITNLEGKKYNVSQITIVKKEPIVLDKIKTTINVEDKKVETVLRKIDFSSIEKSQIKNTNAQKQINEIERPNKETIVEKKYVKQAVSIEQNNVEEKATSKVEIKTDGIKFEKVEEKILSKKEQKTINSKKEIGQTKIVQKNVTDEKTNAKVETEIDGLKLEKVDVKIPSDKHLKIIRKKEIINDEIKTKEKSIELPKEAVSKGEVPIAKVNKKVSVKVKRGLKLASVKTEQENSQVNNLNNQNRSEFDTNPDLNSSHLSQTILNTENNLEIKNKPVGAFQNKLNGELVNSKDEGSIISQEVRQQNSERIVKSIEVIKEISRFISKQEKGTLSFRISPEHLGNLKITLETTEQSLTANIQVENEQAKQLVEKNINILHNQLKESGVELGSLNISLGNPKTYKEESGTQGDGSNKHSEELELEEIKEEKENRSLGYNTYEYLA
ncbi:MAG: flagellar hook-length control protein FliK [Melioribacteraceae bacterium]